MAKLTATPISSTNGYVPRSLSNEDGRAIAKEILSIYVGMKGGI
jgi:hypothetical protein